MGFWFALQFLTIIPSPFHRQPEAKEIGSAITYFPLIGIITGAVLYAVDWGLSGIFPQAVVGALILAVWVLISGAMHLDGLIDTCDGLGGDTASKRLKIMADSHAGAYGVIGALVVLLIKYALLVSLSEAWKLEALLLAPMLGSWALVLAIFIFPYARKSGGLGKRFKSGVSKRRFTLATLLALVGSFILAGWPGLIIAAAALLTTLAIGYFFNSRLGGLTGDVYGAIREITEAVILMLIPMIAGFF
ncbi:adenosylcobinamide-GDP ribazoletransferase [Chloroflexota bacterium]